MTVSEFIKIKKTGHTPQFKNLVGLAKGTDMELLKAFVRLSHPVGSILQEAPATVAYYGKQTISYTLYVSGILKTSDSKKTFYNL